MTRPPKNPLLRLAIAIEAQLNCGRDRRLFGRLPVERWQRCEQLARQIRLADSRGWHRAADLRRADYRYAVLGVRSDLAGLADELELTFPKAPAVKLVDIYQDLISLANEFAELHFEAQDGWLAVTTEPIELEGHDFGPFEIRLDWKRPLAERCYQIIAHEPHPATSRSEVIHPHVADQELCEGEGRTAIRQALLDGRLLDFFALVSSVLRTYNPHSAFVSLAAWHGQACTDCGTFVNEDELYVCGRCGEGLCDECEASCAGCGEAHCSGCLQSCRSCEEFYCPACLRRCAGCRATVCSHCVDDQERCTPCHEETHKTPDEPAEARPEIHADCVGQAIVPA